jgi:hypothetical protein
MIGPRHQIRSKLLKEERRLKALETKIDLCRSYFGVCLFVLQTNYRNPRTQIRGQTFFDTFGFLLHAFRSQSIFALEKLDR